MDALSKLLTLYPLHTALDVRCNLAAPWILEHAKTTRGIAPYHLVLTGTARLEVATQEAIVLHEGDILVFPHGSAHRIYMDGEGNVTPLRERADSQALLIKENDGDGPITNILCGQFEFNSGSPNTLLDALPEVILVRTSGRPDFEGLQALMKMLRVETEAMLPGASTVITQLSSALFALVIRAWLEQTNEIPGLFSLLAERRLQAALQAVLAAPEKPWSVHDMATICHMSRATFARTFHHVAGITPAVMLMQIRMAQAALWLVQSNRTVSDIGEAVGYQSEAAFNRVFKRCFGIGPGQYRRKFRMHS